MYHDDVKKKIEIFGWEGCLQASVMNESLQFLWERIESYKITTTTISSKI